MAIVVNPSLFGINKSNRDFTNTETWGKNQFNSSFPAALACYLHSKNLKAVYVKADLDLKPKIDYIGIDDLFKIDPLGTDTYFAFEAPYMPYQKYIIGALPRNDLVIQNLSDDSCASSFEVKLTALPDNSTCNLGEHQYGSEIVIRPDTIIYLACSVIHSYQDSQEDLASVIASVGDSIDEWNHAKNVIPHIQEIREVIKKIVHDKNAFQTPLIIEPIWKTIGKSPQLADNCLDIFVWSNFGMLNLFLPNEGAEVISITRHTRSMVWLFKMLLDFSRNGKFNGAEIIDELSYNTKNDKAFSTNGSRTHGIMKCDELVCPRILKDEIRNIILGGGQNLLSPERRFDAIIYSSPDLFL